VVAPKEPGADMKGYGILVRVVVEVFGSGGWARGGGQQTMLTCDSGAGRRWHSHWRKSGPHR
jgi:hypothetical protein